MKIMNHSFPPIKDLEEMREKKGVVNVLLPKNASFSDEVKYKICKKILDYQRKSNLSCQKIADLLGITYSQAIEILRGNFSAFSLDSLFNYVEILNLPLTMKLVEDKSKDFVDF